MIRDMLCNQDNPSTAALAGQEESDTVDEGLTEENPDELCSTNINNQMLDDALDSSFTTVENDGLDAQVDSNTSIQDETSYVCCKMCKKRKNQIRKLKRAQKKLEQKLKSRDHQIEALELDKKHAQRKQKVRA